MFLKSGLFFLVCLYLSRCESYSVESLKKCSLKDSECQRALYQKMLGEIGATGAKELGIPPVDPIVLKNVGVSVLNLVNLTMVDGVAKGIGKCVFDKFVIDIDKKKGYQEITCDLVIKGHYTLSANSPLVKDLLGDGGLTGDGKGKVKLEKLHMSFDFPFYPIRGKDGEIYMKCLYNEIVYKYDIQGKASFAADSIYLGKQNVSEFIIDYLNKNYKVLLRTFGKAFIDKAMEFYFDFASKWFDGVPARYYISDDLTPYLKNE